MSFDRKDIDLLITVYDEAMLGIVRSLLEGENIPYHVQERNGSALSMFTGFSLYGADVYVPVSYMERAKSAVAGLEDAEVTFVDDEGNEITVEDAAEDAADAEEE